jgi:hypothetical protein
MRHFEAQIALPWAEKSDPQCRSLHKILISPCFGIESKTPFTFHNVLNHHGALKTGIVGDPPHRLFKGTFNEVNTKLLFAGESGLFNNLHGTHDRAYPPIQLQSLRRGRIRRLLLRRLRLPTLLQRGQMFAVR